VYGFIKTPLKLFAFAITCLTLCLLIFSSAFLFLQIMKSAAHKICTNYSAASTVSPLGGKPVAFLVSRILYFCQRFTSLFTPNALKK